MAAIHSSPLDSLQDVSHIRLGQLRTFPYALVAPSTMHSVFVAQLRVIRHWRIVRMRSQESIRDGATLQPKRRSEMKAIEKMWNREKAKKKKITHRAGDGMKETVRDESVEMMIKDELDDQLGGVDANWLAGSKQRVEGSLAVALSQSYLFLRANVLSIVDEDFACADVWCD